MNHLQEERRFQQLEDRQAERDEAIEQLAKAIFADWGGDFEDCREIAKEQFK
jgi:uncharacterized coiled-coil protein SlyX